MLQFAADHYSCYCNSRVRWAHIPQFHVFRHGHHCPNSERSIRILDPEKDAVAKNTMKSCLHSIVKKVITKGRKCVMTKEIIRDKYYLE